MSGSTLAFLRLPFNEWELLSLSWLGLAQSLINMYGGLGQLVGGGLRSFFAGSVRYAPAWSWWGRWGPGLGSRLYIL